MTDPTQSPGTDLQRQLSEFLYGELLHTLGAYQIACDRLKTLGGELGKSAVERKLAAVVEAAYRCNDQLRNGLRRPVGDEPEEQKLGRRPSPFPRRRPPLPNRRLLGEISDFYADAEKALTMYKTDHTAERQRVSPGHRLGAKLAFIHDPQRRGKASEASPEAPAEAPPEALPEVPPEVLIKGKIDRTRARIKLLHEFLPGEPVPRAPGKNFHPSKSNVERFSAILEAHAGGRKQALLLTIVNAMHEAHMWMHEAEHVHAQSFGPRFSNIPKAHAEAQRMLRYSTVLNTFVFVAARSLPWIFSEDETEREHVIDDYENCCKRLAPTYCMWISAELSLLALHRRAFTWWTMGKLDYAYRDFHKLTRLLRGLRKPAGKRGLRVPGTRTFIEGMTGMSELHIGRIYRSQHSHRMALRYFERASRHLEGWEGHTNIGPVIKNSDWRINLFLNEGKAHYELGHVKRSILCYAQAWRSFLLLVESETRATANVDVVEEFISWLKPVVDEPQLGRKELSTRIKPLVEQLVTLRSPIHLRLMAADIIMRMGHLLFILRLQPGRRWPEGKGPRVRHDLALECLTQAASLDPSSTLAAGDLLRIERETGVPLKESQRPDTPLARQWPSGGGRFEEAAQIAEYTLQQSLATAASAGGKSPSGRRSLVAKELLSAFLAHTDSSNVKLAQVYQYLMQRERAKKRRTDDGEYTLDLVCLRRYASFFPFLPRPSAFRAPGGGYFVQAREKGEDAEPFGIAIDPGPDFIENLYRCGYGLADIRMIILTHDHADHIASVDALLALLGNRKRLGDDTFDLPRKRLVIVGNESVYRRYAFYEEPRPVERLTIKKGKRAWLEPQPRRDAVRVLRFEDIAKITAPGRGRAKAIKEAGILLEADSLQIEPVRSWGHTDANGYVAQAFLLSFGPRGSRCSMLFTGDTGIPPEPETPEQEDEATRLLAAGSKGLAEAAEEADVVVAHLSSVPLRELRDLAGLGGEPGVDKTIREYQDIWSQAARRTKKPKGADEDEQDGIEDTEFLLNQIQFGFRSRPKETTKDFRVSPFTDIEEIRLQSEKHLYLTGLIELAEHMVKNPERAPLLVVGELREELGTFRTQIASCISKAFFEPPEQDPAEPQTALRPSALTADIGLRIRLSRPARGEIMGLSVLCTTCDLDNDLLSAERFHRPQDIREVCVKGEDEGVFYNCLFHDPREHEEDLWVESVERYDVFGG